MGLTWVISRLCPHHSADLGTPIGGPSGDPIVRKSGRPEMPTRSHKLKRDAFNSIQGVGTLNTSVLCI